MKQIATNALRTKPCSDQVSMIGSLCSNCVSLGSIATSPHGVCIGRYIRETYDVLHEHTIKLAINEIPLHVNYVRSYPTEWHFDSDDKPNKSLSENAMMIPRSLQNESRPSTDRLWMPLILERIARPWDLHDQSYPHPFVQLLCLSILVCSLQMVMAQSAPSKQELLSDPRNIATGTIIPSEGYADQPYILKTDDGAWLCAITTGSGHEGSIGQHVVSMRTTDRGLTWEAPVDIEPADGPEASYVVLFKTPFGRVYAFYNHNTERVREVKREDKGVFHRVDSLGSYVFKYSDDHGRSWSRERIPVPVREFECDRNNIYQGQIRFFWNVGRPLHVGSAALFTLHKVGAMGDGFFAQSEGAFLRSENILTEKDPNRLQFETLPDGVMGLRTPEGGGRIAEEQSVALLSDGTLFCVYRTIDGWPAYATSSNGGRTWSAPEYLTYTPDGKRVKHPRAANFVWNCSDGRFLYWFHNHGGPFIRNMWDDAGMKADERPLGSKGSPYDDRNPAWLMAGREIGTANGKRIVWSQPEIVLYDDDPYVRMSYPDLIEEGGQYYLTETQKNIARIHRLPPTLIEGLFQQGNHKEVSQSGLVLNIADGRSTASMPSFAEFNTRDTTRFDYGTKDLRTGFSFDLWVKLESLQAGQILLDNRTSQGKGIQLTTVDRGALNFSMNDGRQEVSWPSDQGVLRDGEWQHVVITVDGGPKIITYLIDGILCDGGNERQFGWGRYSPTLRTPNGSKSLKIDASIQRLRIYNRPLTTSEAVGNFNAGM